MYVTDISFAPTQLFQNTFGIWMGHKAWQIQGRLCNPTKINKNPWIRMVSTLEKANNYKSLRMNNECYLFTEHNRWRCGIEMLVI